jgi:glycosyltransferase involved in cell wall biosynthesis
VRKALRAGRFDLVHAHYAYTGWTARLATTLPLVVSYMGNDVVGRNDDAARGLRVGRFLHVASCNALTAVSVLAIAKSANLAAELRTARKAIIPNGVDLSVFRPMEVDREALGLDVSRRTILFAGRVTDLRKRHELARRVVEIARESVPGLELVAIERRPHEDVARFLNAASCLLITSRFEGSPNIVKEALACNTPVVATDVGDVRERVDGVRNCRIASDDPRALAAALVDVLRDGGRADNGREAVAALDSAVIARQILDLYRRVLAR